MPLLKDLVISSNRLTDIRNLRKGTWPLDILEIRNINLKKEKNFISNVECLSSMNLNKLSNFALEDQKNLQIANKGFLFKLESN